MEKIKKVLIIALVYLIGIGCIFALSLRSEQIDKQKELPVEIQSNSVNF